MKIITATLLLALWSLSAAAALGTEEPVLDTDGEPLKNGGTYAVIPRGLTLVGPAGCMVDVIEATSLVNIPLKLEFPAFIPYISTSLPLNISFAQSPPPSCTKSTSWLVVDSFPRGWPVKIGTQENHEGKIVNGVFSIHKHDNAGAGQNYYKFVFCENEYDRCGNVGFYSDESDPIEVRRLAVTHEKPLLPFQFRKVFLYPVIFTGYPNSFIFFTTVHSEGVCAHVGTARNPMLRGNPSLMKIALLALSLSLLAFFSATTSAVVLDTDGDAVQNGGSYYILPAFRGKGGGLGLARTGYETCPLSVVQDSNQLSNGMPVEISSPLRITIIKEGFPLNLRFEAVPICAVTPSRWTVVKDAPHPVKLTGFYENTLSGSFTIEKYDMDYKLKFCGRESDTCADVGVYVDENGVRQLVMGEANGQLVVKFKKATPSFTSM
ncbi:kunitz-type trypsin inhibitor KTI1-like [Senna tora]|uniref:Kunitz-type trypsin inhibitor KTI1-like n=1 Tax=Senna tora TaxID=362788 RepID=A0A834T371_9FABA|nr:kunitz-type trypsin inhibitor KTI1-like [Senna tora]